MSRLSLAIAALVVALLAAACAAGGPPADPLAVSDAWVRAAPAGGISAAYLRIANGGPDADVLTAVATDAAAGVSIHATTTEGGMTGMQHVPGIELAAGATVALEPGGFHVMLEGLAADLAPGDTVSLVLTFEHHGPLEITAEVREN